MWAPEDGWVAKPKAVTGDTDEALNAARDKYKRAREWWADNHDEAKADLRFARLGEQWPESIRKQREDVERRPCLTFNKMPSFIRQVVNDARQNKPAIKVHPQDSDADPKVAEVIAGLIRNIETTSDADIAYDTAIEHAVGQGFGFWRINTAYTCDDAFDQDIVIERISNPFTVYGDPASTSADSSDWNCAFIVSTLTQDEFEKEYPDAEKVDWEHDFKDLEGWRDGDSVVVAEYWTREKVKGAVVALNDGSVHKLEEYEEKAEEFAAMGLEPMGEPRETETYKVTQRIMTGAEILKTVEWAGKYIPIVAVYGDEVNDEDGKRHFRSLIRDAKSAQQMFNYWRTTTTELIALAPKAPWVGEERSFSIDPNWDIANQTSLSKLMVPDGAQIPQRQPFSGVPAGALQEALNANDDMKAIIGIYDASLGARSNETSGVAINARQREGDVSTFHFIDNLSRAIRHGGRILLDLIPKVYSTERIVRILGEDLSPASVQSVQIAPTGQSVTEQPDPMSGVVSAVYDLTAGKYDLTVSAGPSFTTRREEVRLTMMEAAQSGGEVVASVLIPHIAKLMDIPDADKIGEELAAKLNPQQQGIPPELQQQIQQGQQQLQQLSAENQALKADQQGKAEDRQLKMYELQVKSEEVKVKAMEAQAKLIAAQQPQIVKAPPQQSA
jgi:hypothetical protein